MVWSRVNFYLGFVYTRDELISHEIFDESSDQVKPEFSSIVHQWKCCAALADELFVIGKQIGTSKRIKSSCGQCVPLNYSAGYTDEDPFKGVCNTCKTAWLQHKGTRPEWCSKCLAGQIRFKPFGVKNKMQVLVQCDDCFCLCEDGKFDVIGMQKDKPVLFDGVTSQSSNSFCNKCKTAVSNASQTCPKCSLPFEGIDKIFEYELEHDEKFREISFKFGKNKKAHIVGVTDDCYKCC